MEYILMALFNGGGYLDWQDISQTNYDWNAIFENIRNYGNIENTTINDLYYEILRMARAELMFKLEEYCATTTTKEEKIIADKLYRVSEEDFEIWANCLDTKITFIGERETGEIIQKLFENEIDIINKKIGFTYISFD